MLKNFFCHTTAEERARRLPGDEIIRKPLCRLDNAIDISAPASAVWPWLVQMGADRAGWYSYDRLDNGGRRSSDTLVETLQTITVGSLFPALPGATDAFILTEFEPDEFMVLGVPGRGADDTTVGSDAWRKKFDRANWTFALRATGQATRLHVRARLGILVLRFPLFGLVAVPGWVARLIAPPVHFIMQRRQLNGIRQRVERTSSQSAVKA